MSFTPTAPTAAAPSRADQPGIGRPAEDSTPEPERWGPTPSLSAGRALEAENDRIDARISARA